MRLQQNRSIPNSLKAFSEDSPFSKYSKYGLYTWAMSLPHEKQRIGIIMVLILECVNCFYIINVLVK